MEDWFEYSTHSRSRCSVTEVDAPPVADTYGGHALQFLEGIRTSSGYSHLIDMSWMLDNSRITEVVSADWVAGYGTVSISPDSNKKLVVNGEGCVNIAFREADYEEWSTVRHMAVQTYTWDLQGETHAWNGDEVTLADIIAYKTYKMPGNPCAWVCSNAPGVHTANSYAGGEVEFNDKYEYWKPLVVSFKVTDATAGEQIAPETATASELGVFSHYAGLQLSQRCRVTADSGDFTMSGKPRLLYADADGTISLDSWGRKINLTVHATTDPYSYSGSPESVEKNLRVGKSFDANKLFKWEALGGDGKTHLRTVLYDGSKYVTITDADGKGTVTATAVGWAWLGIRLVADTTGDWKHIATLYVMIEPAHRIVIGSHEWATASDAIVAGGKAVKAVYVCEDGELKQVYG